MSKFIVYYEQRKPWPDEISHLSKDQAKTRLINMLQEELLEMSFKELIDMAEQRNILVEEI